MILCLFLGDLLGEMYRSVFVTATRDEGSMPDVTFQVPSGTATNAAILRGVKFSTYGIVERLT